MTKPITRFAPSPTGYLHLGHAASARAAFGFAQEREGICLLRIEDIDTTRCKPEFTKAIYEDLSWLGFDWPRNVRIQSEHFDEYAKTLQILRNQDLVYRCFKTRKDILADIERAPHAPAPIYHGPKHPLTDDEVQHLMAIGKPYAWRLSLAKCRDFLGDRFENLYFLNNGQPVKARPEILGDVILARKDVGTSYHLACCHDDAHQGVTDIVRGIDLFESTHIHRLLQELLNWPVPNYYHHPLLVDKYGKRFAKRAKSKTLRAYRQQGLSKDDVLHMASMDDQAGA